MVETPETRDDAGRREAPPPGRRRRERRRRLERPPGAPLRAADSPDNRPRGPPRARPAWGASAPPVFHFGFPATADGPPGQDRLDRRVPSVRTTVRRGRREDLQPLRGGALQR